MEAERISADRVSLQLSDRELLLLSLSLRELDASMPNEDYTSRMGAERQEVLELSERLFDLRLNLGIEE